MCREDIIACFLGRHGPRMKRHPVFQRLVGQRSLFWNTGSLGLVGDGSRAIGDRR
jgi:hypothetical protein